MSECYTYGGDTWQLLGSGVFAGQTFRPQETSTLHFIDLKLWLTGYFSIPSVEVFWADGHHLPFGSCLSRDRFSYYEKAGVWGSTLLRFNMEALQLRPFEYYVILVKNAPPLPSTPSSWKYDKDDAQYPGGVRIISTNSGADWTVKYNDDHMFAVITDPPGAKPEPPPPVEHFAPTGITYAHTLDGVIIRLGTSVPCHLTCYYTDKKPLKHHTERTVRGLTVPWATYFCFVAWKSKEQNELGDTMYHTFTFDEWPKCAFGAPFYNPELGKGPPLLGTLGGYSNRKQPLEPSLPSRFGKLFTNRRCPAPI